MTIILFTLKLYQAPKLRVSWISTFTIHIKFAYNFIAVIEIGGLIVCQCFEDSISKNLIEDIF